MRCAPIVRDVTGEPGRVTLELDLPADLPCFRDHFPGLPILAGVVQIDWVMQLATAHLRCGQPSANDFRVKFKRVITPDTPLALTLWHDTAGCRLVFAYRSGKQIASEGHVMLAGS